MDIRLNVLAMMLAHMNQRISDKYSGVPENQRQILSRIYTDNQNIIAKLLEQDPLPRNVTLGSVGDFESLIQLYKQQLE